VIFVGLDWAEAHHDICVLDQEGVVIAKRRVADSLDGFRRLQEMIADHASEPSQVTVGIEKDRGLIVTAMVAAGYSIYAVNPLAASRYRERHHVSGSKSDPGDAKMLADLVRTDRQNHRPLAGDSTLAEGVKILARAHQGAIWSRQRQVNALRSSLKDYYPGALDTFGTDLASADALAVLSVAPTPALGRQLSRAKITSALRRGGRQRNLERRTDEIHERLRQEQLAQPALLENAYGIVTASSVRTITQMNEAIGQLERALAEHFEKHPAAQIIRSLPGVGMVLGARVLGEFGDDPNRYLNAKCRRNYAGTSPVTRASGKSRVVLARHARNRHLADALDQWAFCSMRSSPGARSYYLELRRREKSHRQALRQLANRWVGILHACLDQGVLYDEDIAWKARADLAA
jgi:hypothetical protein